MSISCRRFDHLSWPEAAEAVGLEGSTLVWPFGACEQHGPHLPLITDAFFAERMLVEVLERLPADLPIWMLPAQSLGFSPEHEAFPGTLSLSANLMFQLVIEVGQQLATMGVRRLLLFNAHGGQIGLLHVAARQLRAQCPAMAVLPCFLWSGVGALKDLLPESEREVGLHAGLAETSLMLSMAPELVGLERPVDGDHYTPGLSTTPPMGWSLEGHAPCAWLTDDFSESGVIGDSREANAALGKALEQALVDHWVNLLISLMGSQWPPVREPEGL